MTTYSRIVSPEFRVSFPHVFTPHENLSKKLMYSIVMLFDKDTDLSALKKLADEAIAAKWGKNIPKGIRSPFRNGDEKEYEGYAGTVFCSASSKDKPGIVDDQVQPILNTNEFYPGCYARATLTAYAYDQLGNKGVSFGLQNIQKIRDGEPLNGRVAAQNDFKPMPVTAKASNNSELFGDIG